MSELPRGWAIGQLAEICHIEMGQSPPSNTYNTNGAGLPFLQGKGEFGELHPTPVKYCSHPSKIAQVGSILLSVRAPVGPTNITLNKCCIGRGLAAISPLGDISTRFVLWALRNHEPTLAKSGAGSTFTAVAKAQVASIPIALPPANEQRRIVQRIETLFEEIDRGVKSLGDAKTALLLYRQSLLKSAYDGHLTADWRAEKPDRMESPKALLARVRKQRQDAYNATLRHWERTLNQWYQDGGKSKKPAKPKPPRTLPADQFDHGIAGWVTVPLGLVVVDPVYGTSKKCGYGTGATGVLRIPNVRTGHIDATDLKSADFDDSEAARFSLQEGDVLTVRSNGSLSIVGKPAMIHQRHAAYLFAGYLIRLRPITQSLLPKYLVYMLMEPRVRAQIETKAKSTSGVNNISAKELQELSVRICCPEEQAEIVRILDASLEATEIVDAEIEANLARAEALRQSILKKAFSGQLVPQNPNDEPAATLLQRIEAETPLISPKGGITEQTAAARGLVRRALREAAGNVDV